MKKQYITPKTIAAEVELEELVAASFDVKEEDSDEQWSRMDIGWEDDSESDNKNSSSLWREW